MFKELKNGGTLSSASGRAITTN